MSSTMSADPTLARRRRAVTALAWAVVAAMLATVALSAYMRLVQAGVGCSPWPACFAQGAAAEAGASTGLALARLLHRVVASLVLVLTLLLVLITLATRPRMKAQGASALALLLLTLALAALGVTMRGSTAPPVVLGNLLGGFLMLAVALRLAWPAPAAGRAIAALARLALPLLLLQIALGALLSATRAALVCGGPGQGLDECLRLATGQGSSWRLLDPFDLGHAEHAAAAAQGAWLQLMHRGSALLLLALLAALAVPLWRARRRAAAGVLALLLLVQVLAGGLLLAAPWPLAQVLAHNLSAALLLALLLRLA
jgi:cytochrome c oxidase assembly protein subunit 15